MMTDDVASPDAGYVEGTFRVEGCRGPARHATAERIGAWAAEQAAAALHFALEVDGATFSLLPSREPVRAAALRPDPGQRLEDALRALLTALPADVRGETYSTLHSIEVRPGQLVRCVYAVTPAGEVRREERIVAATTQAPPSPPTPRALALRALAALGALACSSAPHELGDMFRGFWHRVYCPRRLKGRLEPDGTSRHEACGAESAVVPSPAARVPVPLTPAVAGVVGGPAARRPPAARRFFDGGACRDSACAWRAGDGRGAGPGAREPRPRVVLVP
jgi:hypothetical protein